MATNQKIATTELDFDAIKQNLKTFMQGQSEFSDYDFEGSGLSILLDILAYNTHYNSLYTNLAINEAFLDSASKRSSVVSKANELGYLPSSAKSAVARVTVTMINNELMGAPLQQTIPRYATFTTIVDDTTYTFYTLDSYTAVKSGNQYIFNNVQLHEGTLLEYRYVIGQQARLILPNQNIDLTTLAVTVQQNQQSSESEVYQQADQLLEVTASSKVYFIKEIADQLYELEFGNGVIGAPLVNGNIVTVRYIVSNAASPNGAKVFSYAEQPPASTSVSVSTVASATGGSAPESVDQIKWNAPRAYATQNRCVTIDDYKSVITRLYPEAKSVSVWGGETASPPQYGKVYISIIPKTTVLVSDSDKDFILSTIINPRKALTVTPEIVDPTYINIQLDTTVYYNPQLTTRSANDIATLVRTTINNYNNTALSTFEGVFKFSRLSSLIDQTEGSIVSNISTVKLHREVQPVYGTLSQYIINLGNPIYRSSYTDEAIISSGFISADSANICYIDNDPETDVSDLGNLRLFYYNPLGQKVVIRTVGTIHYSTGMITITDLNITRLDSVKWNFVITPQSNDIASTFNQFVQIVPSLTTVRVIVDTPSSGYTFTSSRT